jgi:multicomponent Na+:H+ antiporter subunit B
VIAASSLILLYLGEGYQTWRSLVASPAMAFLEGGGALLFVAAALAPLLAGHPALQNLLPLGTYKDLYSGGLMVIVNFAVGLSVAGSCALLMLEFLEETRSPESDSVPDEEAR